MTLKGYIAILCGVFFGLLFWKNTRTYGQRSKRWRAGKSLVDLALIMLTAIQLPALLGCWCVFWFTRPIKNPGLRVTLSFASGILFGFASAWAPEILLLAGVFAVDLVTGAQGFLGNLYKIEQQAQVTEAA